MINGTVTLPVNLYSTAGTLTMQARAGDKVEAREIIGNRWVITRLIRNGREMVSGVFYADGSAIRNDAPPPPPPPVSGVRAYILRNHELEVPDVEWWPGHPPIPDTRNIVGAHPLNNGRVLYTKRLQYFLYNNLRMLSPHDTKEVFHKEFAYWTSNKLAFFNSAGSNARRVWPLGLNMTAKDMEGNQLTFGGDTQTLMNDVPEKVQDRMRYPLACLDAFDDEIEKYNVVDYPEYWVRPSITYGDDVERQEPFSTFHGRGRQPLILNGTKVAWIEASKVRILAKDEPAPKQFSLDWAG